MKVIQLFGPRGEELPEYRTTMLDLAKASAHDGSLKSIIEALAERNGLLQDAPYRILTADGKPWLRAVK